jgi:hypothetical protein
VICLTPPLNDPAAVLRTLPKFVEIFQSYVRCYAFYGTTAISLAAFLRRVDPGNQEVVADPEELKKFCNRSKTLLSHAVNLIA